MTVPTLGVVIVTYHSGDVVRDCLESLLCSTGVALRIIVVDNGSRDDTCQVIRDWASGAVPYVAPPLPFEIGQVVKPVPLDGSGTTHRITLLETGQNTGFAGGVNRGLAVLAMNPAIDRFWVLNPDSSVPRGTAAVFATAPGGFSLMGGRVLYESDASQIQSDGGRVRWSTGVTDNVNHFADPATALMPDPATFDFISGASMVASRAFYEGVGPLQEDYFLYYEEVDWALRRTAPLVYAPDATVFHKSGTSIGSHSLGRAPSPLSLYFKHRARVRFLWRWRKSGLIAGAAYSLAKAADAARQKQWQGAWAIVSGSLQIKPPRYIAKLLK